MTIQAKKRLELTDDELVEVNTSIRGTGIDLWRGIAQKQLQKAKEYYEPLIQEAKQLGLRTATELIEAGWSHCILNDKEECAKCLSQLLVELNIPDKPRKEA